jgi:putative spermidine/putrescine transport system permease protein
MTALPIHAGHWWTVVRIAVCTLIVAYLIAPMIIVLIISFSSAPFLTFPPPGFSLQWYGKLFGDPDWLGSLITSVQIMLPTGIIATALGTAAAVGIARGRFPGASVISSLLMAPLVVPVIITAAALFGLFGDLGLNGTLGGLILAHTVLTIPYVVATVLGSLRTIDEQLENAALTLGATYWSAFWRVVFPLILPAVLSGCLFAMIISFDELVVSLFISSPTLRPVTVKMWSDILGDVNPTISAIGSVIFLFSLVVLLAESLLRGRWREDGSDLAVTEGPIQ